MREKYWQEGIDSKAFLIYLLYRLPYVLLIGVTGAILGSGLYLLVASIQARVPMYQSETEYYIDFAEGRLEVRDYYNAFTWNDVIATDEILGKAMEQLGADYDRTCVKEMITAEMPSDVRYLTVYVTGTDTEKIAKITDALTSAMEGFAAEKDEFDRIYLIEDNGVNKVAKKWFTWRAAFLGFLLAFLVAGFVVAFRFILGDRIYTKTDITKKYGLPALGLLYGKDNKQDGWQETQIRLQLANILEQSNAEKTHTLFLADVVEEPYAQMVKEQLRMLLKEKEKSDWHFEVATFPRTEVEIYQHIRQSAGAILVVPFGVPCSKKIADVINELTLQQCNIAGAILADVDKRWMRWYLQGIGNR